MLATATTAPCRAETISFPKDHPIGILKIADADEPESSSVRDYAVHPAWECLGPAVGEIQIPARRRVYLHVTGQACATSPH